MLQRDGNSRPFRRLDGIAVGQPRVVNRTPVPVEEPTPTPEPLPEPVLSLPEPKLAGTPRRPKRRGRRIALKYAVVGVAVIAVLPVIVLAMLTPAHVQSKFSPLSLAASAVKAAVEQPTTLKGQSSGRTNVLVYGMTKDGLRTDSIMLASYYYNQKKLVTLNVPRDLYVYDGYENCKMGEIYAYAKGREPKNPDYPSDYVASVIAKEYGINIDYWVKFNMQGEVQLVDTLGGVDINVPDSFTDYEYPTWNYSGYVRPAPHFVAGPQHMDGATALIYSRSRHSLDNGEGSDFARSKRQTLVLAAVMTKVKSLGIVGNLPDIEKYLTILGQNVDTNMSSDEMVAMAKLFKSVDPSTDYLKGNWSTTGGFLCSAVSSVGADIIRYGAPGNCTGEAGITSPDNTYRDTAISYVQNLLTSVTPPPSPSPSIQPQALGASTGPSN